MRLTTCFSYLIAVATALGACGDDAPELPASDCAETGRYLELRPGASWTYRVTDVDGVVEQKTQTVGALETMAGAKAGVQAYRLTTTKGGGGMTISWQEDRGSSIVRHAEEDNSGANTTRELYVPYRTRVDESEAHLVAGMSWTETYTEQVTDSAGMTTTADKSETWIVQAIDEDVTVPAGRFCSLRVRRTSTVGGQAGSDKTYWFVRGIGKVKETGAGQTEELESYQ